MDRCGPHRLGDIVGLFFLAGKFCALTSLSLCRFVIGEAVPFFNDLLSLISALFDSVRHSFAVGHRRSFSSLLTSSCLAQWFGLILWGYAVSPPSLCFVTLFPVF